MVQLAYELDRKFGKSPAPKTFVGLKGLVLESKVAGVLFSATRPSN